ncbi:sugar ABC transporter substrate-binding protein [Georgenia halophila]|uniref:Sugar ABC transporter substrate-binding protein n=2 Tax=Georgenia halophila TaxID=620889 RepID=A0ABP8L410_9MICO
MAAGALALTACSGDDGGGGGGEPQTEEISQEQFDEAMSTPTDLTFWTWVPDIQNEVDMFMEEYPEIDVEVVNVGQGADHYQQLRTALEAGEGAPDVAQMEYQHISSFRLGEHLLDLAPYLPDDMSSMYPDWVWSQITAGEAVYGVPQDTGPMGNLYRTDLFEEAGIEAPETWAEFADAARTYREATPDSFITNLPPNQAGQMMGFLWQAGARPFGYDGEETVRIELDSPEAIQVVEYWQDLVQNDLVAVDPDFNDQWYQAIASGKYASWQTAAWGPVFLQGTAGSTSGLWRATELPQWEAGEHVSGNWGGSTDAVMASSQNPIAAAELARWINVEKAPAMRLATEQFLFPPSNKILEDPEFLGHESEFYGGQKVNELFAEISTTVPTDFGWLPFMEYAYSSYNETLGDTIANRGDMVAGLRAWEQELEAYAENQGFTVE